MTLLFIQNIYHSGVEREVTLGIHYSSGLCGSCDRVHHNIFFGFLLFTIVITF